MNISLNGIKCHINLVILCVFYTQTEVFYNDGINTTSVLSADKILKGKQPNI